MLLGIAALSNVLTRPDPAGGLGDDGTLKLMARRHRQPPGLAELALVLSCMALGAGLAEELFFRGFLQARLSRRFSPTAAVARRRRPWLRRHALDSVHAPVAALLGLYLGWIAERAGSIVPAIVAHVVNNSMAVLGARWRLPESDAAARLGPRGLGRWSASRSSSLRSAPTGARPPLPADRRRRRPPARPARGRAAARSTCRVARGTRPYTSAGLTTTVPASGTSAPADE